LIGRNLDHQQRTINGDAREACIVALATLKLNASGCAFEARIVLFIGHAMKIVKTIVLSAIVVFVVAFTQVELRHLMREGFWPGLAGVLICVGVIVVLKAWNARKRLKAETADQAGRAPRRRRSENFSHSKIDRLLAAYPGPITLAPSRLKWLAMIVLSTAMTAASIFVCVIAVLALQAGNKTAGIGIGMSILGAALFGFATVLSARTLLVGSLQLDRIGFQVTLFGRNRYLWAEVSDFRPYRVDVASGIQFHAVRPRSRYISVANAWLGYSNDRLSDTYGLGAEELVDLMEGWQSAALDGQGDEQALAPADSEQESQKV
jgi:hypothetical protein